ncbi:unnamed protein product, partial [Prunus brigantina]
PNLISNPTLRHEIFHVGFFFSFGKDEHKALLKDPPKPIDPDHKTTLSSDPQVICPLHNHGSCWSCLYNFYTLRCGQALRGILETNSVGCALFNSSQRYTTRSGYCCSICLIPLSCSCNPQLSVGSHHLFDEMPQRGFAATAGNQYAIVQGC